MDKDQSKEEEKLLHETRCVIQSTAQLSFLYRNLPAEMDAKIFSFLDYKEFFMSIVGLSKKIHHSMLQEDKLNIILGPFIALYYKIINSFLETQSQLHAPLGILLGRNPKFIRQFLLEDKTDIFDADISESVSISIDERTEQKEEKILCREKIEQQLLDLKIKLRTSIDNPKKNFRYEDMDPRLQQNVERMRRSECLLLTTGFSSIVLFMMGAAAFIVCLQEVISSFPDNVDSTPTCIAAGIFLVAGLLDLLMCCMLPVDYNHDIEDRNKAKKLLTTLGTFKAPEEKTLDNTIIEIKSEKTISNQWNNSPKNFSTLIRTPGIGFHASLEDKSSNEREGIVSELTPRSTK